jgi:hypothetical protein
VNNEVTKFLITYSFSILMPWPYRCEHSVFSFYFWTTCVYVKGVNWFKECKLRKKKINIWAERPAVCITWFPALLIHSLPHTHSSQNILRILHRTHSRRRILRVALCALTSSSAALLQVGTFLKLKVWHTNSYYTTTYRALTVRNGKS